MSVIRTPRPPAFNRNQEGHRRQIRDYCIDIGELIDSGQIGSGAQTGFLYSLKDDAGASATTPSEGEWTKNTAETELKFHTTDGNGVEVSGSLALVAAGNRIVIENDEIEKLELYTVVSNDGIAADVATYTVTKEAVGSDFDLDEEGLVRASAIGASDASTVTYTQADESDWDQPSPTVVSTSLDELADKVAGDGSARGYAAADALDWSGTAPTDIKDAVDRLAERTNPPNSYVFGVYARTDNYSSVGDGQWARIGLTTDPINTSTIKISKTDLDGRSTEETLKLVAEGWRFRVDDENGNVETYAFAEPVSDTANFIEWNVVPTEIEGSEINAGDALPAEVIPGGVAFGMYDTLGIFEKQSAITTGDPAQGTFPTGSWARNATGGPENATTIYLSAKSKDLFEVWEVIRFIDVGTRLNLNILGVQEEEYTVTEKPDATTAPADDGHWNIRVTGGRNNGLGNVTTGEDAPLRLMGVRGEASSIKYEPGEDTDWISPPEDVKSALDGLAQRATQSLVSRTFINAENVASYGATGGGTWDRANFETTAVTDDLGLWDGANQRMDFTGLQAPPTGWGYEADIAYQCRLGNNTNNDVAAGVGLGSNGDDPENTSAVGNWLWEGTAGPGNRYEFITNTIAATRVGVGPGSNIDTVEFWFFGGNLDYEAGLSCWVQVVLYLVQTDISLDY